MRPSLLRPHVPGRLAGTRCLSGEWLDARSRKTFESINPCTGRVWATAPEAGEKDVDAAVVAARRGL